MSASSRTKDSHPLRPRSNSHLSATASQFQDLNIGPNVRSLEDEDEALSEAASTSTPSFLELPSNRSHQTSSNSITAPVPQQYTSFPFLLDGEFCADWSYNTSVEEHLGSPPLVRLDPACSSPHDVVEQSIGTHDTSSRSKSYSPTNMR